MGELDLAEDGCHCGTSVKDSAAEDGARLHVSLFLYVNDFFLFDLFSQIVKHTQSTMHNVALRKLVSVGNSLRPDPPKGKQFYLCCGEQVDTSVTPLAPQAGSS